MHYSKMNGGYYSESGELLLGDRDVRIEPRESVRDFENRKMNLASDLEKRMISKSIQEKTILCFGELRRKNLDRNAEVYDDSLSKKSLSYFGNALAGEVGEACNFIKKIERGDPIPASELGKELADIVIYADLIASKLGLSLGQCVVNKFNEVSDRVGSNVNIQ